MRNQKIDPIPFTKTAFETLKLRFEELKKLESEILIRLQAAREMGDLSENGAYKYAKFELGNTRRELGRITHLLRYGFIKEKSTSSQTIEFGSLVKIVDQSDQKTFTYTIVSQHESDPAQQKISTDSPLGKVLINKSVGETVELDTPAGSKKFLVLEIN